jgi:hypothetical protein
MNGQHPFLLENIVSLVLYFHLLIFASFSLGEFGITKSVLCLLVSGSYQNIHILPYDIIKKVFWGGRGLFSSSLLLI